MICIGFDDDRKRSTVSAFCAEHEVDRVVVLSPSRFRCDFDGPRVEHVEWAEIIEYEHFYRLLRTIGPRSLVVVNECLRTQNRSDLTYNCIRHFLNQTTQQIAFQYLPIINTLDDIMILIDFDTRSRWKREPFSPEHAAECEIVVQSKAPELDVQWFAPSKKLERKYASTKRTLIDNIGLRDPHTIPRKLHLLAGKEKLALVRPDRAYVGRNNRFKLDTIVTYRACKPGPERTVFEFSHNVIEMADMLTMTRQSRLPVLAAELKVERWYVERYQGWLSRIQDAYAAIS